MDFTGPLEIPLVNSFVKLIGEILNFAFGTCHPNRARFSKGGPPPLRNPSLHNSVI